MAAPGDGRSRTLGARGPVRALVAAHFCATIAEWVSVVAVLVYAYERGGAQVTGLTSLAVLAPVLVGAPAAAALLDAFPPLVVRRAGLGLQVVGYASAVASALADAPVAFVAAAAVVALTALCTLRPTAAVLLPALVRSTDELLVGSLRLAHAESISVLAGPVVATVLLALGGPAAALTGCAVLVAVALTVSAIGVPAGPPADEEAQAWRPGPVLAGAVHTMRARPWTVGLLVVLGARNALLGALDVLLVVLAFGALDIGGGGAGLLNALVGLGAVVATMVTAVVVRRTRLAPWLAVGLAAPAALVIALSASIELPVAVAVLPLVGLSAALVSGLGSMLLQRSGDPRVLESLFAMTDVAKGIGLLVGSGLAQVLLLIGGDDLALAGLGVFLAVVLLVTARSFWRADAGADVPVVEMRILQEVHLFAPLPPVALEAVARSATHVSVADGEVVIREGEPGDRFYAVADGAFGIVVGERLIRVARRGSCFGEVALLADVPRTATVTARGSGELLAVDRVPFLVAVTGSDTSRAAAWGVIQAMPIEVPMPSPGPDLPLAT